MLVIPFVLGGTKVAQKKEKGLDKIKSSKTEKRLSVHRYVFIRPCQLQTPQQNLWKINGPRRKNVPQIYIFTRGHIKQIGLFIFNSA
jgi:hypothetical protein